MKLSSPLLAVLLLLAAEQATAACSTEQIRRLIQSGKTDGQIDALCRDERGLPGWLSGRWTVTQHLERTNVAGFTYPATTEVWEVEAQGKTLAISEVRDAHLTSMSQKGPSRDVRNVRFDGNSLSFQVRSRGLGTITTTSYNLAVGPEEDILEGTYASKDGGSFGLPPLQMSGRVVMVKE